jgi:hypothetical protein
MPDPRVTQRATPPDLGTARSATGGEFPARCHPLYGPALSRAPAGRLASRGLPFALAEEGRARRWLALDRAIRIELGGVQATHLVLLAFCDAWRDASGRRPEGVPVGWVMPVGEPLAVARIHVGDGTVMERTLRRRFEVNEGIIGWGSMAFLALPHRVEAPIDWRGPHAAQGEGRYAQPGHSGPLTVLPGTWGPGQTGVEDHVPSPTDDLMLWMHAIDVGDGGAPRRLSAIQLEPLAGPGDGRLVVVAALTAFSGSDSPLRWAARRSLGIRGAGGDRVELDLGVVARRRPIPARGDSGPVTGWGLAARRTSGATGDGPPPEEEEEEVEVTAAADAVLYLDGRALPIHAPDVMGRPGHLGGARVRALPPADHRMRVTIVDEAGRPAPARVRFLALDGRYLAPQGHRSEVNPGLAEDLGADVLLGTAAYAYVGEGFEIDVPAEGASFEVVGGLARSPLAGGLDAADVRSGSLRLAFGPALRPSIGHWVTGDTHVHFLAPSTALLQARAEGINAVHLLATSWGDHHTSLTDIGGDLEDAEREHAVWVGSENRQNMLGHVGIVGTRRPVLPFTSGGPPEGPIGAPVTHLVADWLLRCRELGGLAIGAHFPLPMAEVMADIEAGLLDAVEMQCFDLALESPPIREWYRCLDAGYRLPLVAGTDKMSAAVPLGQVRTWARLEDETPLTFAGWAAAVRAGRTFVTSGPVLELRVEGREPGDSLSVPAGTLLEVELVARAAQPLISALEVVQDGRLVLAESSPEPVAEIRLRDRVRADRSGWLAGRSRSPYAIGSAFATAMAAHTSPVYLEVAGRPQARPDMSLPLTLVDGTRAWLEALAPVRDDPERVRFRRFLDESERRMRERGG